MRTLLKRTLAGLALAVGLLASGTTTNAAYTNVLNVSGGIGGTAGGPSGGFWDNNSSDFDYVDDANIGNFLTASGQFTGDIRSPAISLGNLQFLDAPGFYVNDNTVPSGTKILIEVAGNAGSNELWFWKTGALAPTIIFTAGEGEGATDTISLAAGETGTLVLVDTANNKAYFSDGAMYDYTGPDASWHSTLTNLDLKTNFAAFVDSTGLAGDGNVNTQDVWIGIEDLKVWDDDYNDMVIHLTFEDPGDNLTPTPAPPALVLALVGVVPCLALRRRLRSQVA